MKKPRTIILLLTVLILLLGGYAYVAKHPKSSTGSDSDDKRIELSKIDIKKMVKMTFTTSNGEVLLEKKGDSWVYNASPSFTLDQSYIMRLEDSFSGIYAERLIQKNSDNLSQYGLQPPAATAKIVLNDGTEKTFYVGDKTPQEEAYYFMAADKPEVYTIAVAAGDYLKTTLFNIRDKSLTKITVKEVDYLKITRPSGKDIEIKESPNKTLQQIKDGTRSYDIIQPVSQPADDGMLNSLMTDIAGYTIEGFENENAQDLKVYGLDKPAYHVIMKDKQNTRELLFGKDKDSGLVYFKTADSNAVYSIKKERVHTLDILPFDLVDKHICKAEMDKVDKIIVEHNNTKDEFALERKYENGKYNTTYKVNNKQIDESKFQTFYNTLSGLTIDLENDKQLQNKPEMKITLILNSGAAKERVVNLVSYNADFYGVFKGDKAEFLISKQKLQELLTKLNEINK